MARDKQKPKACDLTQERLKELIHYNPDNGEFTRIKNITTRWLNGVGVLSPVLGDRGYKSISVDGWKHRLHRLAFLYMEGYFPEQIDHINHKRDDNRWCNLREVNFKINARNMKKSRRNKSGVVGVHKHGSCDLWVAQIKNNNKTKHIGAFKNKNDAIIARKMAEVEFGYHKNHGVSYAETL